MSRGGTHPAAEVIAAIGFQAAYRCACGVPLFRPGDKCATCHAVETKERRDEEILRRVKARVPAAYRWADLRSPEPLRQAMANPRLLNDVMAWMVATEDKAPTVLLLRGGDTKALKSTIAAACVRYETEAGRDAAFVLAVDLAPIGEKPTDEQRETRAEALRRVNNHRALVAIDDLAKVLGGAPGDTKIAAYRSFDLCQAIARRCQARARTIVTLDLENRAGQCGVCLGTRTAHGAACVTCNGRGETTAPGIVGSFGEDVLSRLTDPHSAVVVRLERKRV